jgi:fermentation-respiration switch protein FrsA (DUF1100 family)
VHSHPHRSREALVFSAAAAVALLHALDDAFLHRGAGVGLGQHALAALLAVVGVVGAIYLWPSMRPMLRFAVAFFFGSLATVNGMLHVKHLADQGAGAGDVTGVLAAAAGAVLVGLAISIPWLHRGEGAAGPRRRWAYRILAVPVGVVAFFYTVLPIGMALTETHKYREPIGSPPSADYREVSFDASDGVHLSGWYRPTQNGATILVVHGGGGDRTGAVAHAKLLVRHGYGVLLHDARGRGKSEGVQNAYGWGWDKDVAGAIAFLKTRDEVDPERLGGLGLSTGADALVQAAGQRKDLKAVVADGTAAESLEDWVRFQGITTFTPFLAAEFAAIKLTSGAEAGQALEHSVKHISSPVLLVSGDVEKAWGEKYDRDAGDRPLEHWHLPGVGHTAAIRQAAPEYERRVTAFFDDALGGEQASR